MKTNSERGAALILALMLLSFLAVLGGALLTSATLDVWIGDNYKTHTQALYLAEAGIELARENLRTSGVSLSTLLAAAAGPDAVLSSSSDLTRCFGLPMMYRWYRSSVPMETTGSGFAMTSRMV